MGQYSGEIIMSNDSRKINVYGFHSVVNNDNNNIELQYYLNQELKNITLNQVGVYTIITGSNGESVINFSEFINEKTGFDKNVETIVIKSKAPNQTINNFLKLFEK